MKKVVINIKDRSKEEVFIKFLKEIPFISVEEGIVEKDMKRIENFRKLVGIWKDRNISLADIRKKAWQKN